MGFPKNLIQKDGMGTRKILFDREGVWILRVLWIEHKLFQDGLSLVSVIHKQPTHPKCKEPPKHQSLKENYSAEN